MEWIPETEPFLEYESLKEIINESIGTIVRKIIKSIKIN